MPNLAQASGGDESCGFIALIFGVVGIVILPFCLFATTAHGYRAVAVDVVLLAAAIIFGKRGVDQTRQNPALRGRRSAIVGLWLGIAGGALLAVLLAIAVWTEPDRLEPMTPEQLAVTKPIDTFFSALAADNAALACAQLTADARTSSTPVFAGNVGWLRCRGKPVYRGDPAGNRLWTGRVYNVTITGNRAAADHPFGSDRYSNGWSFRLVRVGGRWLIADAWVYSFSGG